MIYLLSWYSKQFLLTYAFNLTKHICMHIYTERERKESLRMLKREFSSDLKQLNTAMFYVKKKKQKEL